MCVWLIHLQPIQFLHKLAEEPEGGVDGFGCGHVDPGNLQKGDGVGAAAAGEETLVILHRLVPEGKDALGQGGRGGEAGGVLIDIVVIEEVRAHSRAMASSLTISGPK